MTDKQKYFALQALVCELMPDYAARITIRAGYPAKLKQLQNAKYAKVLSLPDLVALVRHSLPDFEIPAHLLPEEQAVAA